MSNTHSGTDYVPHANRAASSGNRAPDLPSGPGNELPAGVVDKIRAQAASLRNATAFTQAIGVFMRSPHYREYTIGDLEWLLIPALTNRQYRLAEAKTSDADGGRTLPAAIVLWAFVSTEVDQRLMEGGDSRPKLNPSEWTSGDIPWLVHAAGEARFIHPIVNDLMQTAFKDRKVKVLGRDEDNSVKIYVFEPSQSTAGTA